MTTRKLSRTELLERRVERLEAENVVLRNAMKRMAAKFETGVIEAGGKKYRGLPITRESHAAACERCSHLLPEQFESSDVEGSHLQTIFDRDEVVAGIERYIVRYRYSDHNGCTLEHAWRAVEL
jgi:hypothetical protein